VAHNGTQLAESDMQNCTAIGVSILAEWSLNVLGWPRSGFDYRMAHTVARRADR